MKTFRKTNLLFLATLTLFTACSTKTVEPPKKVTQQNLPAVLETTRIAHVPIEELPLARTYPMPQPVMFQPVMTQPIMAQPVATQYVENYITDYYPRRVATSYAPINRATSNITKKIEWDAKRLLGKKYVWGATGPKTYDCSGFTQKVYRDAGIRLPRVSRDQARVGQYIGFNNLRKGDLMFFDTHAKRTGRVSHVGIYLGNGNFIHASSGAKKIVIFNLNSKPFYKERFLWARRVINPNSYIAMN